MQKKKFKGNLRILVVLNFDLYEFLVLELIKWSHALVPLDLKIVNVQHPI